MARLRRVRLSVAYLNGAVGHFSLPLIRRPPDGWRAGRARAVAGWTTRPGDLAEDLADLRWEVTTAQERDRLLPPVVALWDVGDAVVAACRPDRYSGRRLPLAAQERWFSSPSPSEELPDPERLLCWWPSRKTWEMAHELASRARQQPAPVTVSYLTLSEWVRHPDARTSLEEALRDMPPPQREDLWPVVAGDAYAAYVRAVRTTLYCLRQERVPFRLTREDGASAAQAAASALPDLWPVEEEPCGREPALPELDGIALITGHSYWPGLSPSMPEAVVASFWRRGRCVWRLVVWTSPLADPKAAAEGAADILWDELAQRGMRRMAQSPEALPLVPCRHCQGLLVVPPAVPPAQAQESQKAQKVGRNDPCPCGSGRKYKRCCGRPGL